MVRRGRQAFTLIEILVVIGIILLLIAIGVIGFQHLDKVASEKATKTNLDMCGSILSEYQADVGSLNAIEAQGPSGNPASVYTSVANGGNNGQCVAPGDVNLGSGARTTGPVVTTGTIILICSHTPQVKSTLSQLPASSLLQVPGPTSTSPPSEVLLDAWKNPVIYVPASGLSGVTSGGRSVTVYSVDGQPFWASAGQDGNFQTGDDNIYSTAVIMK